MERVNCTQHTPPSPPPPPPFPPGEHVSLCIGQHSSNGKPALSVPSDPVRGDVRNHDKRDKSCAGAWPGPGEGLRHPASARGGGGGGDGTGSARPLPRAATREIPPSPEGRERRCLIPKLSSFILGRMGKEPLSPKLRL